MEAVVDPEPALRLLVYFRHKLTIRAAAVEVVMAGAQIIQACRDATHGGSLTLRHRVLRQRRVYSDVHVRIDATRKSKTILGIEDGLRALRLNVGSDLRDLAVFHRNIEAVDRCLFRTDH